MVKVGFKLSSRKADYSWRYSKSTATSQAPSLCLLNPPLYVSKKMLNSERCGFFSKEPVAGSGHQSVHLCTESCLFVRGVLLPTGLHVPHVRLCVVAMAVAQPVARAA